MKRFATVILSVVVGAMIGCSGATTVPGDCERVVLGGEALAPDLLVERVGIAEAESDNLRDGIPFGDRNDEWLELKETIEPGDELWFYRDNRAMAGAEAYVLLRDCEVVAFLMTTKY